MKCQGDMMKEKGAMRLPMRGSREEEYVGRVLGGMAVMRLDEHGEH